MSGPLGDACCSPLGPGGGGGGGAVTSVFGRTGAVVALAGDYTASLVDNDSAVLGGTGSVADALDSLLGDIATLAAPIDLTGTRVVVGPANTFLGSNGVTNQWLPVFNAPASPGDNGKLAQASSGNFAYLGGTTTGQALIWNNVTPGWAAGNDFGALSLTTTGGFIANISTGFARFGLASGSGSGVASAAAAGNIRGARGTNGFQVFVRNNGDTADLSLLATDTVSGPTATFGSTTAGGFSPLIAAPAAGTITLRVGTTATQLQLTTASVSSLIPRIEFFSSVATGTFGMQTLATNGATGNKVNFTGQDCTGTTSTGGAADFRPGSGTTAGGLGRLMSGGGAVATAARMSWNDVGVSWFATAPAALQTVSGSRGGATVAVLTALLAALGGATGYGLINDTTTA